MLLLRECPRPNQLDFLAILGLAADVDAIVVVVAIATDDPNDDVSGVLEPPSSCSNVGVAHGGEELVCDARLLALDDVDVDAAADAMDGGFECAMAAISSERVSV